MKTTDKAILFALTFLVLTASIHAQVVAGQKPMVLRAQSMEEVGDETAAGRTAGRYDEALWYYAKHWLEVAAGYGDDGNAATLVTRERLVGKMANAVAKLRKPPVIPESSEFHSQKGTAFVKLAKTPADFAKAVKEFQQAVNAAPWVFDYHFNLAVAYKLAGKFKFALNSLNLAKILAPTDKDRRDVNRLRAEIEAAQEISPR